MPPLTIADLEFIGYITIEPIDFVLMIARQTDANAQLVGCEDRDGMPFTQLHMKSEGVDCIAQVNIQDTGESCTIHLDFDTDYHTTDSAFHTLNRFANDMAQKTPRCSVSFRINDHSYTI